MELKSRLPLLFSSTLILLSPFAGRVSATVINYTDLPSFHSRAGVPSVVTFADLVDGTPLSMQYAGVGVTFSDGNDVVLEDSAFVTDQHGVWGHGSIALQFSSPIHGLAADFAGALQFDLFIGSLPIGTSQQFAGFGDGLFGGVVSSESFDRAIISDWYDGKAFVDNLYIQKEGAASVVPDTGTTFTLLLVTLGGMTAFWRSRCRRTGAR